MSKPFCDIPPADGYPEPYATLLATLDYQTGAYRYQLGRPETEEIAWQPYPKGYSIGSLFLHMAVVELDWIHVVALGRELDPEQRKLVDPYDSANDVWQPALSESIDYYFDLMDRVRAQTYEAVRSFGDPETVLDAGWGTVTLRWILAHLVWHESYHGGQAVMLSEAGKHLRIV